MNAGRSLLCALLLVLLPTALLAQANPTLTEAERGIRRDGDAGPQQLRIDELRLDARVAGRTATVTLDMLIASASATPYEANLSLLLPADAVITGYALDVGGRMIPGQLLERPRARNLYEDEVRKGIDPGLAEVTAGNRFATRIFPIDAAHPRRFRVTFAAPFDPAVGLVLPLARDAAIGRVEATVRIDGYSTAPGVQMAGQKLEVGRDGRGFSGGITFGRTSLRDGLVIAGGALTGPMTVTRHANGEAFFAIADGAPPSAAATRGGRLRVYWDRSRSHRDDDTALETETLARLVDLLTPDAIDLVTFASDRPTVATLRDAAGLRAALRSVTYRGATSFGGLDALALPDAGRCVLVSDGQVTIDRAAAFAPDCALAVLTAAGGADGTRLGRLAQASGGPVVRVEAGGAAAAAAALARPSAIRSVRDASGRRIDVRALPAGTGGWLLVGPMPAGDSVHLRLTHGTERIYKAYPGANAAAIANDAPGALWAAQRVAALADDPAQHESMAAFSRRYSVAGPAMSLLVLETPEQYLTADLPPPPGFAPEWMIAYRSAKAAFDEERADDRQERFAQVLERWAERVSWWNTRFTPRTRARPGKRQGDLAPPPMVVPAPPPPPALSVAPPAPQEADGDNIAVTASRRADAPVVESAAPVARVPAESDRTAPQRAIGVELADLSPKRPYIAALAAAAPGDRLRVLAEQERAYGTTPAFYLDTADWFRGRGDAATAGALLLSALDLPLSDDETRQIVAFRLERDGAHDRAIELAEALAAANAGFRPQPARALALALAARGRRADLERAFALLTRAALDPASSDYDGLEVIALAEANALIPLIERAGGRWSLDRRLVGRLDTDARIVIEWTADDADIDLWVNEPNGERVYYGDQLSSAGGRISNDMTDGYGPEEYAVRRAPAGAYQVRINGYDADRINPNGPGHVLVRLQRNFARPGAQATLIDLDLSFQQGADRDDEGETRPVATLRVAP